MAQADSAWPALACTHAALQHSDMELHDMEQQVVQLKRALQSLPQLSEGGNRLCDHCGQRLQHHA